MNENKPKKLYGTILANPPWDISQKSGLGAHSHYDLMTLEQIKAMPVKDLAKENAHLWLWTYPAALRQSYEVVEAWGFSPKALFTWVKPRLGLGRYLRNCTEHIIFGTRGKTPVRFKSQMNWGFFPIQSPHSHKPEEQYAIIERVSPGAYLELFARRRQPGWDVWGDEIASDIEIPGYPVPEYRKDD